jgi:hypothetical protein
MHKFSLSVRSGTMNSAEEERSFHKFISDLGLTRHGERSGYTPFRMKVPVKNFLPIKNLIRTCIERYNYD